MNLLETLAAQSIRKDKIAKRIITSSMSVVLICFVWLFATHGTKLAVYNGAVFLLMFFVGLNVILFMRRDIKRLKKECDEFSSQATKQYQQYKKDL